MTQAEAAELLRVRGVSSAEPEVPVDVVLSLLTQTARAGIRANSTAYVVGDRVVPATANGRVYECIVAGTSASSVPTWPTAISTRRGFQQGYRVVDGTATWADAGYAHKDIYDLNAASRECWLWRAQHLAQKFDVSADGMSMKRSQLYEFAIAQARRYGWRGAL